MGRRVRKGVWDGWRRGEGEGYLREPDWMAMLAFALSGW